jgi:hypothetical protein
MLAVHESHTVIIFADDLGAWVLLLFRRGSGLRGTAAVMRTLGLLLRLLLTEPGEGQRENGYGHAQTHRSHRRGAFSSHFHETHISREKPKRKPCGSAHGYGKANRQRLASGWEATMPEASFTVMI